MAYIKKVELDDDEFEKQIEYYKKTGQAQTLLGGTIFINGKSYTSQIHKVSNYIIEADDREQALEFIKQLIAYDLKVKVNDDVLKRKPKP